MGNRRKSREIAMQAMYMYEVVKYPIEKLVSFDWITEEIDENMRKFSEDLIRGTISKLEQIDVLIKEHAKNWKFDRIDNIDKAILRISIFSLLFKKDIPAAVTIDEAIEIGKIYGGNNSGHFVNGILDTINKKRPGVEEG